MQSLWLDCFVYLIYGSQLVKHFRCTLPFVVWPNSGVIKGLKCAGCWRAVWQFRSLACSLRLGLAHILITRFTASTAVAASHLGNPRSSGAQPTPALQQSASSCRAQITLGGTSQFSLPSSLQTECSLSLLSTNLGSVIPFWWFKMHPLRLFLWSLS